MGGACSRRDDELGLGLALGLLADISVIFVEDAVEGVLVGYSGSQ